MTLPTTGGPELALSQAVPETTVNEMCRRLDANCHGAIIEDRDLTAPPGSNGDGAAYLVATSPTGAWSGQAGKLAISVGVNASNGWYFQTVATEGFALYVRDEDKEIQYNGTAWVTKRNPTPVTTQSGTTYTAVLADADSVIQFSNGSAITFTIPTNASVPYPAGTFIEIHQTGAGAVTPTPDTGVTLNVRTGFSETAGQYAVAAIRKVATNTWILTGDLT